MAAMVCRYAARQLGVAYGLPISSLTFSPSHERYGSALSTTWSCLATAIMRCLPCPAAYSHLPPILFILQRLHIPIGIPTSWRVVESCYLALFAGNESEPCVFCTFQSPVSCIDAKCEILTGHPRLKCDRAVPCSNCVARNTTCVFAPQSRDRGPPLRAEAKQQLDARLRRLEQSVNSLVSKQSQPQTNGSRCKAERQGDDSVGARAASLDIESGQMVSSSDQTIYVSGSHWASICYEVKETTDLAWSNV